MTVVSYPGVYIREIASGVRPIAGVATSIGLFVGMAKRGPINRPTRVFGYKQFTDIFSADTSQGEMPDQVRQFFLNGGPQCFIVRIADNANEAFVDLANESGATVLRLTAKDAGLDSNALRAVIDYNTASAERSFNLTIYRERFAADGTAIVEGAETFSELSMDADAPRYVETIVEAQSALVGSVTVNAGNVAAAASVPSYSASARLFANDGAVDAAIAAAVAAANPTGNVGFLQVRLGRETPWMNIQVDSGAATMTDLENAINTAAGPHTATTVSVAGPPAAGEPMRITASAPGVDVMVMRAANFDIAGALGLGSDDGGVEFSSFAPARPAPTGLVARLEDAVGSGDLDAILAFSVATKANLAGLGVAGVRPFTVTNAVAYPGAAGTMADGVASTSSSLANVRENLLAIASALSAASSNWRAEVQGLRLALIPTFGSASAGAGATFTSNNPNLSGAGQMFDGLSAAPAARPFAGGIDGNVAQTAQYAAAFDVVDRTVDLFNIMVLPQSAADTGSPRILDAQWGPASVFAQRKRAFLIIDPDETGISGPDDVVAHVNTLRLGVVKDHSAIYWPRVRIPAGAGAQKTIAASGSVAGVYARTDANRGVWKAPAGLEADLRGVTGVSMPMSDGENGVLNPRAINAIRSFNGTLAVWGARTNDGFEGTANPDYRYIPVRRFALFMEESLYRGLQWAVFEPNDEPLWAQMRGAIGSFMNNLFRQGAFAGQTAREAYFVKVDSETTTQNDINLGIVNALIGFAPLKPAEFIIVTLQQKAGQVQV